MVLTITALSIYFVQAIDALSIKPVTPAVNLTQTFTHTQDIYFAHAGYMTYYIDPNNATNTTYLWVGTSIDTGDTYISSDVFTILYEEYPLINGTIDIANSSGANGQPFIDFNYMCTSPQTKDIMTCWRNQSYFVDHYYYDSFNIDCRLYFVKTNTFSDIITVTDDVVGMNTGSDILCFDDSYFLPYSRKADFSWNNTAPSDVILYGAIIDLEGQIKYSRVELKNLGIIADNYTPVFSAIAYEFNPKQIDYRASHVFSSNFGIFNETTNVTDVIGLYGYYTSIHDPNFPIYFYNETHLKSRIDANVNIGVEPVEVLNWSSTCCYISVYRRYVETGYRQTQTIYGSITDIHGKKIDITQYPDYEDILFMADASGDIEVKTVDLPMISNLNTHYFGIFYGKYNQAYYTNATAIRVFYLQFDYNNDKIDLYESADFDVVKVTGDNHYYEELCGVYNLPQTNYLCFACVETSFPFYNTIYGQTFLVS